MICAQVYGAALPTDDVITDNTVKTALPDTTGDLDSASTFLFGLGYPGWGRWGGLGWGYRNWYGGWRNPYGYYWW